MVIYSTLWSDYDPAFNDQVETIDWRNLSSVGFERAFVRCRAGDVLIINGAVGFSDRWRDIASAVFTLVRQRGVGLVVSDATWQPRADRSTSTAGRLFDASDRLNRFLVRRLIGPRTVFCFLSSVEVEDFLATAPAPPGAAAFTPFSYQLPDEIGDVDALISQEREPFVFSGGNTLRDWPLLVDALGETDLTVRIAAQRGDRSWPSNFEVAPRSEADFFRLAATARVGVLTLRGDVVRSCGQQTYLNLLRIGTPVVVNDAPGVREHLEGIPGATITGCHDAEGLRSAVLDVFTGGGMSSDGEAANAARCVEERFAPPVYRQRLIDLARGLGAG